MIRYAIGYQNDGRNQIAFTTFYVVLGDAMTCSIMTLSIMTLSIMTLSIMTLSIMTFSITKVSIKGLFVTPIMHKIQHKSYSALQHTVSSAIMLSHGECRFAECRAASWAQLLKIYIMTFLISFQTNVCMG